MNEEYNSGIKPWQWIVSVLVVLALLGLGVYMMRAGEDTEQVSDDTSEEINTPTTYTDRIVISDQFPGNIVYISTVELKKDGFVVIHKGVGGKPGAVIGSEYFTAGNQPGSINLTEKTVDGATYYAMLHMDDGDKIFDPTKDLEVKDDLGNAVMKTFKATTDLPEDKG